MLDALIPAATPSPPRLERTHRSSLAAQAAASAAQGGAKATAQMSPRRGRSSYLGARALGHPDPGAEAVATWLLALARAEAIEGV